MPSKEVIKAFDLVAKREEIQELIDTILQVAPVPMDDIVNVRNTILDVLNAKGCVLKVDRVLPDEGMGTYEATRGAQIMYQNLIKLGYVAVEPLIEQ